MTASITLQTSLHISKVSRHERRLSQIDAINEMPLYPTEQVNGVLFIYLVKPVCSTLYCISFLLTVSPLEHTLRS